MVGDIPRTRVARPFSYPLTHPIAFTLFRSRVLCSPAQTAASMMFP